MWLFLFCSVADLRGMGRGGQDRVDEALLVTDGDEAAALELLMA